MKSLQTPTFNFKSPISNTSNYLTKDEQACLNEIIGNLDWDEKQANRVSKQAQIFITQLRQGKQESGTLESFMQSFSLTTDEGIALMCLAEALMRVPDKNTANALIKDKITSANWRDAKKSADWMVKAAGLGLIVTRTTLESALERVGKPLIRTAILQAMEIMGSQFVLGETIEKAIKNAKPFEKKAYGLSYDMLGEGARTFETAKYYFAAYENAIHTIGKTYAKNKDKNTQTPGISVKLSALYPRYELAHANDCVPALTQSLSKLCALAASYDLHLTVDAEEVERLELSIAIFDQILNQKNLQNWTGLGLAVQAYQKRAFPLIYALKERAEIHNRIVNVRLVKGAYWDREIKHTQVMGLKDYPVFTRKINTDCSFIACAELLLSSPQCFKPMFGTHNAHTIAAVLDIAIRKKRTPDQFTLQRLHGMGEQLFDVIKQEHPDIETNIYAPVGPHKDLLAYLVRRLLENGANSSFVNQILDHDINIAELAKDPIHEAKQNPSAHHHLIPLPQDLYQKEKPNGRINSNGLDIEDSMILNSIIENIENNKNTYTPETITNTAIKTIESCFQTAKTAFHDWNDVQSQDKAAILKTIANTLQSQEMELISLLTNEAKKTIPDAIAEIREAIDFCRYYANLGENIFDKNGTILPGPTGEKNLFISEGRGVFVCISPWNFPLAIFTGQVVAALMAGNTVIAKPAEQTPQIAEFAVRIMHQSGIPKSVLQCVHGDGKKGAALINHNDVSGVAFTGSTAVAKVIQRSLAAKDGPIIPLIAETGGQNVMIVDSTALPEQVIDDIITSAFESAGQRCSALRVLCVQDDIADTIITMLKGAMETLNVGEPGNITTDIPPVIDGQALKMLNDHKSYLDKYATFIAQTPLPETLTSDTYFAPCAYELDNLSDLQDEKFGPILHIVRFKQNNIGNLLGDINALGYGLTCGIHSRIQDFQDRAAKSIRAGNIYINRSMIGAVVGTQPFGGMGLSGTGPKAGGPHYLHAFATEKTITTDTTAAGGNTALVSLDE